MTMIIGMTGGIACGKTAATDVFRSLGVPVIDADEISRELTGPGGKALPEIAVAFGADMIGTQGMKRLSCPELRHSWLKNRSLR